MDCNAPTAAVAATDKID